MIRRNKLKIFALLSFLILVFPLITWAGVLSTSNSDMSDPAGNAITGGDVSGLGDRSTVAGVLELAPAIKPPAILSRQDYEKLHARAQSLLAEGIQFRLCRLQLQTALETVECPDDPDDPTDDPTLDNYYADFNSGELLDAFCPDFVIDERGYCQDTGDSIRNKLMEARWLFTSLYLAEPPTLTLNLGEETLEVKTAGLAGMLATTHELAYAHMIFGSEYAIDAFDYRFTIAGQAGSAVCEQALLRYQQDLGNTFEPNGYDYFADADCVIANELNLLEKSRQQYEFAIEVMTQAYHDDLAWPQAVIIGQLFTQTEIQIFSVAVENYAIIADEIAIRQRQLGDEAAAIDIYSETYDRLFLLTIPLLERAATLYEMVDEDTQLLLDSNGLAVRAGLDMMRGRLQEIENGINLFGYNQDHVPVQSYFHMDDASDKLLAWARIVNDEAINVTREFDINTTQLNQEMANVRNSYQRQLVDLCGDPEDIPDNDPDNDYEFCVGSAGSFMERSWLTLASAVLHMNLAQQRIESTQEKILDIQARTEQIIQVKTQTGEIIAATTLAQGMARAYQVTNATSSSVTDEVFQSVSNTQQEIITPGFFSNLFQTDAEQTNLATIGGAIGSLYGYPGLTQGFNALFGSTTPSTASSETAGTRHSEVTMTSVNTVFNPAEITIAELENVKAMAYLAQEIEILNIDRAFEIRDLFRLIAELQIEKEKAVLQYNQAVSEHNGLIQQWLYLKAQYKRARADLNANYLANPAYRLLKDQKTEEATYQLVYAARQAYLTAKALEYHIADEVPFINDVFKVRHPAHLQAYLHKLEGIYNAAPGINESEVEFSLRVIASGIRDQDISNASSTELQALIALRQERFLTYLQEHLIRDQAGNPEKLVLIFDTSLENRPIDTPSRYNWRIAGAVTGSTDPSVVDRCPVRKPYGVQVKILPGPQTLPNGMTVDLTMSGHTSTRQGNSEIVEYSPQLVTLLPREDIPNAIRNDLTDAVADASIDVGNVENTISDFCNMSVAANSWLLEIPLAENQIDWTKLLDIKLKMWTFYYD